MEYQALNPELVARLQRASLNDLYYHACELYTSQLCTGSPIFKQQAEEAFQIYKSRGGKRNKLISHLG